MARFARSGRAVPGSMPRWWAVGAVGVLVAVVAAVAGAEARVRALDGQGVAEAAAGEELEGRPAEGVEAVGAAGAVRGAAEGVELIEQGLAAAEAVDHHARGG